MNLGWYKLHRELFEKAIWKESTPEQKVILIALLGMANHQKKEWEWKSKPFKAMPGQFVTSNNSIIERCGKGITEQKVRTALKKFKRYGFLTDETTKVNRLITIVNWGKYQEGEIETNEVFNEPLTNYQRTHNEELTNPQRSTNEHLTTNKNVKNDKNVKNEEGKEGEEKTTPPSPILSPVQEKILNSLGPISYKTWIANSKILETKDKVTFIASNNFTKVAIEEKFKRKLEIDLQKQIEVKEE